MKKKERLRDVLLFLDNHRNQMYTLGVPLLIAAVSLIYYFSYYLSFINLVDEGFLVNGALRVLEGQVPLVDFWSYPPVRYYVLAGLFQVFGVNVATERIMWIMLMTIRNVLLYSVSRRLLPPLLSLPVVISIMLIPGSWHKTLYSFLMFIHLFFVFRYVEKPSTRRGIMIGIVAGLFLYFRQDYVLFAVVVNFLTIIKVHWSTDPGAGSAEIPHIRLGGLLRSRTHIQWMLLTAVLIIVPLILFYSFQDGFAVAIRRIGPSTVDAVSRVYERVPFPSLLLLKKHLIRWPLKLSESFARAWFLYFVLFILSGACCITVAFIGRGIRGKTIDMKQLNFFLVALVWTGLSSYRLILQHSFHSFLIASQSSWILAVFLWHSAFVKAKEFSFQKKRGNSTLFSFLNRFWRWALLIVLSVIIGFSWYFFLHYGFKFGKRSGSIAIAKSSRASFKVARAQLMLPFREAKTLKSVIAQIRSRTSKHDTIFAYRYPMFYFLSERRNATELDNIIPPAVIDQEAEVLIKAFRDNPPQLQVIDLSSGWLATIISEYPCDAQDALFNNYRAATVRRGHLFLELHRGSNAWEAVQKGFAKRKRRLTRALDCQP